jgi:hypothetical protein
MKNADEAFTSVPTMNRIKDVNNYLCKTSIHQVDFVRNVARTTRWLKNFNDKPRTTCTMDIYNCTRALTRAIPGYLTWWFGGPDGNLPRDNAG